ncbi:hypothetical protein C2G38_2228455 [Gigaspora rosea]|uniref:Uncharacterized protein n=1 Tax=Gigaspora rosea TaxID=44941 RepID=A0A397TZ43_9GLOM|nr:hypothetical protein C2G38_2228455 [Gigaspora rosea]
MTPPRITKILLIGVIAPDTPSYTLGYTPGYTLEYALIHTSVWCGVKGYSARVCTTPPWSTPLTSLIRADTRKCSKKGLCANATLISLKLLCNNFEPESGKELESALCENKTLLKLELGNNKLRSKSGKTDNNRLRPKEGEAFVNALYKNTTLSSLDLSKNPLGPKGSKALKTHILRAPRCFH